MKIKTITCHDVYNVGASLQAYALLTYLKNLGHDVEIIDYKPDYLSNHYSLIGVNNSVYDRPVLREIYQILKFPGRLCARFSRRKKEFDCFKKKYLLVTGQRYVSNEELKKNMPEADVYFAGSDQIWNTMFQNGKDPAFYLEFAPKGSVKASYAASFATDSIADEWRLQIAKWLSELDFISVRESSGVRLAGELGNISAIQVLDPVFLLNAEQWMPLEKQINLKESYVLLYDFDKNPIIENFVKRLAKEKNVKIYSFLSCSYADRCFDKSGPQEFLTLVHHAEYVVSNSFHATAFSILFKKQFAVFNRLESINARMQDLLEMLGLTERMVTGSDYQSILTKIDYGQVYKKLENKIDNSKMYIDEVLKKVQR